MNERPFKTTFFEDFTIADKFGKDAVLDTYKRAFKERKSDYKYLTELVIALNWKIWEHYDKWDEELAKIYNELWEWCDWYAMDYLKWAEFNYYISQTD